MKARTKTTRWLLIALLFGLLAATGLALTLHHGAPKLVRVHDAATPQPALNATLPAAISTGTQTVTAPAGAGPDHEFVANTYSNTPPPQTNGGNSNPPATPSTTTANTGWGGNSNEPAVGGNTGVQPSHGPATTSTPGTPPLNGAGDYANNGYAPLDCELPAGCGAPGSAGYVSRPPSGASGEVPTHDSSSPTTDGSGTQTNNNGNDDPPPPGNNGNSEPPGQNGTPSVHSAPELDPATLAGAVTLLLGALAVLRSRRVRATR